MKKTFGLVAICLILSGLSALAHAAPSNLAVGALRKHIIYSDAAVPMTRIAIICNGDDQCSDGNFCNGRERCEPTAAGADARGCVAARGSPCLSSQICIEERDACINPGCETPDRDGDHVWRLECGGSDCDDDNPNRYRGNIEVWDLDNRDEDCDLDTIGVGHESGQLCVGRNVWVAKIYHRRVPPALVMPDTRFPGQRIDPPIANNLGGVLAHCPTGTACVSQLNGAGVCMTPPPGYTPPAWPPWYADPNARGVRLIDRTIDPSIKPPVEPLPLPKGAAPPVKSD